MKEGIVQENNPINSDTNTASINYTVDSFSDGIAFGQHRIEPDDDPWEHYDLKLNSDGQVTRLRSRYALHKENPFWELERHLMRLSQQGVLSSSCIYFGTSNDPFFPFEGKFDASMKFLQLFERYTPGRLVVQTRSPLVVIAIPVFKKLGDRASVTIAIETPSEEVVRTYTPGFPRVEERLRAARALRRLGVQVTLQVSPLLPYGDWRSDAKAFASLLVENGDYITVRSITDGSAEADRRLKNSVIAKKLAIDRKFHWLRPDTASPVLNEIAKVAPQKLCKPRSPYLESKQMGIFAA